MVKRTLTNAGAPLLYPDGTPASKVKITFTLIRNTGTATDVFDATTGERIAPGPVIAMTDSAGVFSIDLWPTTRGELPVYYLCKVPILGILDLVAPLPENAGDYTWIEFKTGSVGGGSPPWTPSPLEMLDASAWPDLATACNDLATYGKTLWISTAVACDTLTIFNRDIRVLQGGLITVNPGATLTFKGSFGAGAYQCFAGSGSVVLWGGCVGEILPEWFMPSGLEVWDAANAIETTAGIQKAFDTAGLSGGGGVLLARKYLVNPLYLNHPNIAVLGLQKGLLFDSDAASILKLAANQATGGAVLTVKLGCTSCTLRDFLIDGDKANQTQVVDGLKMEPSAGGASVESSGYFDNVRVFDCSGKGINQGLSRRGWRFDRPMVYGCTGDGVYLGGSDNEIYGGLIGGNGGNGIKVDNWAQSIIGCDIWDNATGIFLNSGGSAKYVNIIGNKFDRMRGSVIYCNGAGGVRPQHVSILGNQFHNNMPTANQPTIHLEADHATVMGNTFGSMDDGTTWATRATYSIFVPTSAEAGTHSIIGNPRKDGADIYGILSYRGNTNIGTVIQGKALIGDELKSVSFDFYRRESQAANTPAGGAISGRNDRVFTDTVTNTGIASDISGAEFTLQAGTYRVTATAPAYKVNGHKVYLRDRTNGVDLAEGTTEMTDASVNMMTRSTIDRLITITGATVIALEHFTETARSTDGLGRGISTETGRFAEIRIWRIS